MWRCSVIWDLTCNIVMLLGSGLLTVMKFLTMEDRVLLLVIRHMSTDVILTRVNRCVLSPSSRWRLKFETESEHTVMGTARYNSPISTTRR